MEPAVPFAALGAVTLLAVASWAVLAAAAVALRGLRAPALLLGAGALLLGAVEVRVATDFSADRSDPYALLRAAGTLLVTAGVALGALAPRPARAPEPARAAREPAAVAAPALAAGVVVPLAAAPAPAAVAALAAAAAAGAALRARPGPAGRLLALGLLAAGAAAGLAPLADDGPLAALAVLGLRGLGAALLLAGGLALGRRSLLAKVVAAILAGVLVMAAAAFGVVGTAVTRSFERQATELVTDTAQARASALAARPAALLTPARALAQVLDRNGPDQLPALLQLLSPDREAFVLAVDAVGDVTTLAVLGDTPLGGADALVAGLPVVQAARTGQVSDPQALLVDLGVPRGLAAVAVVPGQRESPELPPDPAVVLVSPVTGEDLQVGTGDEGYAAAVLSGGPPTATAATSVADGARLQALARRVLAGDPPDLPFTVPAEGDAPTLRLQPVGSADGTRVALLAVARDANAALAGQREALSQLLLAALATTAAVGVLALVLGRRTVDPVRRLTAAATRVAAGDLSERGPAVRSGDEVGTLARTFATMTGSLATLTGDLRATAARLETVLASMDDGLLATDGDGRVTSVNRAALAMLQRGAEEVLGRALADAVDVRDDEGVPLALAALRPGSAEAQGAVHRPDGTTLPVAVALTALRGGAGGDAGEDDAPDGGVVLVLRDTTREREVERMKTEFLSNVSHELRTPLTPIRGYADILSTRAEKLQPAQVATFAGTILSESLKMNRVVDLLVDVAALEAGRVRVTPRDVAVRELVDGRLAAWRARVPERAEDLRRRVAADLPPVHVDPTWVAKALDELVDNALKYSPPGTPVTLSAALGPDGTRVRVTVRDAGPGIAEADQRLLFTSFEQVDGSATRRVGGLGLGLSFVRRVAEDAGFPLRVTSAPGRGSAFALDLPLGTPVPPPPRRRRRPAPA